MYYVGASVALLLVPFFMAYNPHSEPREWRDVLPTLLVMAKFHRIAMADE